MTAHQVRIHVNHVVKSICVVTSKVYSRSLFGTSLNSSVVISWLTHFAQFVDVYFTVANLLLSAVVFPMFVAETADACVSHSTCL